MQDKKQSETENEKLILSQSNKDQQKSKENMQCQNKNEEIEPLTPKLSQYKNLRKHAKTLQPKSEKNIQNEQQLETKNENQISSQLSKNKSKENNSLLTPNKHQCKELRQKSKTLQPKSSFKMQNKKQSETENEKLISSQSSKDQQKSEENLQSQNKSEENEPSTPKLSQYKNLKKHAKTLQSKSINISHSLSIPTKKLNFSNSNSLVFNDNNHEDETCLIDSTLTKSELRKNIGICKTTQFKSYRYLNYETSYKKIRPSINHSKQWLDDAHKYY